MGALAFTGRLLFALLFLGSGIQKLQTLDFKSGGPVLDVLSPKLDELFANVHSSTGYAVPVHKDHHLYFLIVGVVLEIVGALLFVANWNIGAWALILYTSAITPAVHDFWNSKDDAVKGLEIIMFFKNVALIGALLFYLGSYKRPAREYSSYKLD
ncbi:hypothetical protein WJX73_007019 [Symbiochloris irregularis]|uniref:DoxX family protein n=1 Tax=Symbiochloris irregularis TaxID=706552 RepID=A0AAW1P004_9CHLO